MIDEIDSPVNEEIIRDIVLNEFEAGISCEMSNVCRAPGDQVVDANYRMPLRDKAVTEVRTEESCSAGDN
jgi:hypothetical protein